MLASEGSGLSGIFRQGEVTRLPAILGEFVSGENCTIRRALATEVGSECEFVADELLIGGHITEGSDEKFKSAIVHYSHMEEWAYVPLYEQYLDKPASKSG